MYPQVLFRGMALLRGTCLNTCADSFGVKRVTLQTNGESGVLNEEHAATFIKEMGPRYKVTYATSKGEMHFVVRAVAARC